jgi:hypothetical protein
MSRVFLSPSVTPLGIRKTSVARDDVHHCSVTVPGSTLHLVLRPVRTAEKLLRLTPTRAGNGSVATSRLGAGARDWARGARWRAGSVGDRSIILWLQNSPPMYT